MRHNGTSWSPEFIMKILLEFQDDQFLVIALASFSIPNILFILYYYMVSINKKIISKRIDFIFKATFHSMDKILD